MRNKSDRQLSNRSTKSADTKGRVKKNEELQKKIADFTDSNRKLKRKIFDLYTIFEISRNFNAVHNYLSLLDSFIYTCLGQVGSLKGAMFLIPDGRGSAFYFTKGKGSGPHPSPEQHFDLDSPLLLYLTKLNRPVLVEELMGDISSAEEKKIFAIFHGGILVPLIYQTRLSGIFIMSEKMSGSSYEPADTEFLSILGNQIAVAIQNTRLYESERAASRELREAQQQLLQSERLAALGEMSARVAHEVNNPLGIMKNYLTLIKGMENSSTTSTEYIEIVEQEIDRIARIVRQLLDFHRPHIIQLLPVDVESSLEEILILMERPMASDKVTLVRKFSGRKLTTLGDMQSLKQVFLNIIINARDAMPEGGELVVETSLEDSSVVIKFIDSGPGISAQLIPKIFEPFFSTKDSEKGTGLGLSVCYGIMKQHRGSITFTNVESGGCFEIRLPIEDKESQNDTD